MSPSQQLYLVLGRLWLYYQARRKNQSLSLPVPGNTEAEVRPFLYIEEIAMHLAQQA